MPVDLTEHIRNVPDFPVPGVQFKDITSLLLSPPPDFLRPGIRGGTPGFAWPSIGNPPLQPLNHPLLFQNGGLQLGDDGDEDTAVGGGEVNFSIHALYMT